MIFLLAYKIIKPTAEVLILTWILTILIKAHGILSKKVIQQLPLK